MADDARTALDELMRKAQLRDDVDFLREGVRALAQARRNTITSLTGKPVEQSRSFGRSFG